MYESHFGLKKSPFRLTPDTSFLFLSPGHKTVLTNLEFALSRNEGIAVVTGAVGTGKTLFARQIIKATKDSKRITGYVASASLTPTEFLEAIAIAFSIVPLDPDSNKITLTKRVTDFLDALYDAGQQAVLIIDEAQNLTVDCLEELKILSSYQIEERSPIQFILLGQPELKVLLAQPSMAQITQRVVATCELTNLSNVETQQYIEHRLRVSGWTGNPELTDIAAKKIAATTRGIPRLINNLVDRLLLKCYVNDSTLIDSEGVDEVSREVSGEGLVNLTAPGSDDAILPDRHGGLSFTDDEQADDDDDDDASELFHKEFPSARRIAPEIDSDNT